MIEFSGLKLINTFMKIPFGFKENRLWFVTDVSNGAKCNCTCPKCDAPLQAKNNPNNIKIPHFAHLAHADCSYSGMTDVHLMAQQILLEHQSRRTPEFRDTPSLLLKDGGRIYGNEVIIPPAWIEAQATVLEYSWKGFQIDVAFPIGDKQLLMEIAVTYFIEPEKRRAVVKGDVAMIEIDLSGILSKDLFDKEAFTAKVLSPGELAVWINNPKGNALVKKGRKLLEPQQLHQNSLITKEEEKRAQKEQRKVEKELERKKRIAE